MVTARKVAAMVGHDLRGPLQTIKNSLNLMEYNPEEGRELMETMDEAVDNALSMLEELRLNVGDSPLQLQEVNLIALTRKAVHEASIPDSMEAELHVDEGLDSVSIDPLKIGRLLDNLVRNAVEAIPEGGVLEVTAAHEREDIVIQVSNTGTGIPEDRILDLFKMFATTKRARPPQLRGSSWGWTRRPSSMPSGSPAPRRRGS